jgi:DNA invertase Pin-like site-specific DNA recombinase
MAYSYIRFSSPDQATGDSFRRQTQAREDWLGAHPDVVLDKSLVMTDKGRSAFKRKDWDTYALAQFVQCIKSGRVKPGAYLLVENLDRLSREDAGEATELFLSIVNKGIVVVQLSPVVMEFRRPVNLQSLMFAIVELSRGHSESAMKSDRIGKAWANKRKAAREQGTVVARRLPGWVTVRNGKLVLIPQHAATVKRIFQLAAAGYGQLAIVKKLRAEKVPTFLGVVRHRNKDKPEQFIEKPGEWNRVYVKTLLNDRRVLGELQLYKGNTEDSEHIKDYFPAAVTDAEWYAARAGCASRDRRVGRASSKYLDLFNGLLLDARTGGSMMVTTRTENGKRKGRVHQEPKHTRLIVNTASNQGHESAITFPLPTFERAILSCLREVNVQEILGEQEPAEDVTTVLEGELAQVEAERAEAAAFMEANGFSPKIGQRITTLEARKKELEDKLEAAKAQAARPLGQTWGEFKSLVEALDNAKDPVDARTRLRAALRRIVTEIRLLVVPHGRDRLCFTAVYFAGGTNFRTYLIIHRPSKSNGKARQEGRWYVASTATSDRLFALEQHSDLRNPDQVEGTLSYLERLGEDKELTEHLLGLGQPLP